MAGKTIYGETPRIYADLLCKRCRGRVIEDEIYYENGKAYQDLLCLLCSEHYYLTISEWNKQKDKMVKIIMERKRLRREQSNNIEDRTREVLSSSE